MKFVLIEAAHQVITPADVFNRVVAVCSLEDLWNRLHVEAEEEIPDGGFGGRELGVGDATVKESGLGFVTPRTIRGSDEDVVRHQKLSFLNRDPSCGTGCSNGSSRDSVNRPVSLL